jgi:uncharacterized membrane protein HdeD (DUF308 family)
MTRLDAELKRTARASLMLAVIMIISGALAIALPVATSIGVVIVIGWLVVLSGLVQVIHAFQSRGIGHIVWKTLIAVLYVVSGGYLLAHPALGLAGLTLVLGIFLGAEGVADLVAYVSTRKQGASPWMLADGIISLALGFMIWDRWPFGSLWVIGTLVGVSMVMTGTTRLMMAVAAHRVASHLKDAAWERAA